MINLNNNLSAPTIDQASINQQADSAQVAPPLDAQRTSELFERAKFLLKKKDMALVAHYYTDAMLQRLADETGGCVSDSLDMARFGHNHSASTLIVAGVRFMGETAKIITPEKRILMPTLEAECSLDLSCPEEDFKQFCDAHPERTVVVYANTSAAVKARADWVVTSSIAKNIVTELHAKGEKIIWGPDKYLGDYIQKETGADILLWQGSCVVHERFKAKELIELKLKHPDAAVLVHPESPAEIIELANIVGSTTQLINAAKNMSNKKFIVATDNGIFYKMKEAAPGKIFIEAPNAGIGASCQSCAHCPWMAMNNLENLVYTLETGDNEIIVEPSIAKQAMISVQRMLNFAEQSKVAIMGHGSA